jgi:hypothetical protein
MKILKNLMLILAFASVMFSCQKEIIKPVNQVNTEKTVVIGYDDDGNPLYKDVTDPDEDDDFEGVKTNQN